MKINRNSWHYRLIKEMNFQREYCLDNTCKYALALIESIIYAGLVIFIIMAALILLVSPWLYILVAIVSGGPYNTENPIVILGMSIQLMLAALIGGSYIIMKFRNRPKKQNKEPSVVASLWRNFKDKTCTKIEFDD